MLHHTEQPQITIVSFFTQGWIQQLITTIWRLSPEQKILVIDNNPDIDDALPLTSYPLNKYQHNPMVEAERYWLKTHTRYGLVIIKQTNRENLTHGCGMDLARTWCLQNGTENMTHVEPDCVFDNMRWYEEQSREIESGIILAGCFRAFWCDPAATMSDYPKCPIHPSCTTYHLPEITHSFQSQQRLDDMQHPQYCKLVSPYFNWMTLDTGDNKPLLPGWDTGHKVWFEAAKTGRCVQTNTHGLDHLSHGTLYDYWSRKPLEEIGIIHRRS